MQGEGESSDQSSILLFASIFHLNCHACYIDPGTSPVLVKTIGTDPKGFFPLSSNWKTNQKLIDRPCFKENWRGRAEDELQNDRALSLPEESEVIYTCIHQQGRGRRKNRKKWTP